MIRCLAGLVDRLMNRVAPLDAEWLAGVEADREVFEPDELWAAEFRRRWERTEICPKCRVSSPVPMARWEQELHDSYCLTDDEFAAKYPKSSAPGSSRPVPEVKPTTAGPAAPTGAATAGGGGPLTNQEGSPRTAATAGGVDTRKGQPVPEDKITELRRLLKQAEDDDRNELAHLRAENAALRAAIAKMEARPIPYRLTEVTE